MAFGFGGRLASFSSKSKAQALGRHVEDRSLVNASSRFEAALASQDYAAFCDAKVATAKDLRRQANVDLHGAHLRAERAREAARMLRV